MRSRRGQATVEYMLLLCAMLTLTVIVGTLLKDHMDVLLERLGDKIVSALIALASP